MAMAGAGIWTLSRIRYSYCHIPLTRISPFMDIDSIFSELSQAVKDPDHGFHWPILVSSSDNNPDARTMVLRGVHTNSVILYSDSRAEKVRQLEENPSASLVFFDRQQMFQLRTYGTASIHIDDDLAHSHLSRIPSRQMNQFNDLSPPGSPTREDTSPQPHFKSCDSDEKCHFALISVRMTRIDALMLSPDENVRWLFEFSGGLWKSHRITP